MRALLSFLSRAQHRVRGAAESPSRLHPSTSWARPNTPGVRSSLAVFGILLRKILLAAMMCGGGYWLSLQNWTSDGAVNLRESGESDVHRTEVRIQGLTWSSDGKVLLSRSMGSSRDENSLLLHTLSEEGDAPVYSHRSIFTGERLICKAVLLPDALAAVVIDESNRVTRIDIKSGMQTELLDISAVNCSPSLAVSCDGSCLAVALDGEVRLCDPLSGQEFLRLTSHDSSVTGMAFCDDGGRIAAGYANGSIRVWNRSTGAVVCDLARHAGAVSGVNFVNECRHLASIGVQGDDTLRLWNLESSALLWKVSADLWGFHALAVSADGRLAATGGGDGQIILWDLNERVRLRSCSEQTAMIRALKFSPDGTTLTSAASDGTICIWDVETTELLSAIDVGTIVGEPESRP